MFHPLPLYELSRERQAELIRLARQARGWPTIKRVLKGTTKKQ